jgi:elongation factor G
VKKAMEKGRLAGYPVVDVKVRLTDGKSHSVDSSDAAFQSAGMRGFRAAMAASHPSLLEPIAKLEITFPREAMGDVLGDLSSRHGKVQSTTDSGESVVATALLPLAQTLDYEPKLTAITHGRGSFTMAFDHYDFCPKEVEDKVIKDSGIQPVAEDED